MEAKKAIFEKIQALATECHQAACSLDVGAERTEMFEVYGVLHNLSRRGYASQVSSRMNPLFEYADAGDEDDDWDEDDE